VAPFTGARIEALSVRVWEPSDTSGGVASPHQPIDRVEGACRL
jgi:hypothetical protein